MKKRILAICIVVCICFLTTGVAVVYAATGDNLFFLAGQFFKSAQEETARPNGNEKVLATYDGEPITSTVVEYYKNMTILNNSTNSLKTDRDVVDYIIMNMILTDEATRLGISASDSDIEAFVSNAIRAYEIPEGKKVLDAYFEGAGITMEEYLEYLREQAPSIIARQRLKDEIGRQYCEENGLEFTKVNPPVGMEDAQEEYINKLFEDNKDKIEYHINDHVVS